MSLFETEIKELEELDNRIAKKNEEEDQILSNYGEKIQTIKNFQIEREIKNKVELIFSGMDKVVKNYLETEKLLYSDNTYDCLFKNSYNPIEISEFLTVLKESYEIFYKEQSNFSFARYGNKENDDHIYKMAKSYWQVCYIKQNIQQFIQQYIYEEKRKSYEVSEKEKECTELVNSIKKDKQSLIDEAKFKIKNLDEKIKKYDMEADSLASILPSVNVSSDFSNDLFYLGKSASYDQENVVLTMPSIGVKKDYCISRSHAIKLSESSGFKILYDEEKSPKGLWSIIKALSFKWIIRYPGAFKQIMAIHDNVLSDFGSIMSFVSQCGKDDRLIMRAEQGGIQSWVDKNNLPDAFEKIKNIIQNRIGMIGGCKNIFEYNEKNPSNAQSLLLVFALDFDFSDREDWQKKIEAFLEVGHKVGLYFAFMYNRETAKKVFSNIAGFNALPEYSFLKDGGKDYLAFTTNGKVRLLDCLSGFENITESNIAEVRKQIEGFTASFDFIKDFQNKYIAEKHDYFDKLIIPVGIHGSKIQTMTLTRNGLNAHAIIEGASGAGKTSMLNNIILSAAYNYSPDELEIYIFDFKNGNDNFIPFGNLKHVKYIGVNQNAQDTMECLQYIRGLLENNKNANKPRALIVVDEYTNIKDNYKCVDELVDMVRKARSFGGDMFFSSQNASIKEIVEQCGNRFEMYENENYQLVERVETLFPEIKNKESRLVVFSDDKNKPCVDMKFPYVGENIMGIIEIINEKYKDYKTDKIRLDENPKLSMQNYPGINSTLQGFYVPVGERHLTHLQKYFYFDNDKAQKILLVGDRARSASIERIVANAFIEVNRNETLPCVYYFNFDNGIGINPMQELNDKNLVKIANSDKEKGELFQELYDLFKKREEDNYNGKSDFSPVAIILQCAGNARQSFKNLEKFRDRDQKENHQSDGIRSLNMDDVFCQNEQISSQSLNYKKVLDEIFDSNLDFHIIIHYQDWREAQNHEDMPGSINDFSNRVFVPMLLAEGKNDLNLESITQAISRLIDSSNNFDTYYKNKMQDIGTNSANRRDMLHYIIFIENETPCLVMPYEYEV